MNWTTFQIHDLTGGMLLNSSPFLVERNRPKMIMNFSIDNAGVLEKDYGYSQLGVGITTTSTSTSTTTTSSSTSTTSTSTSSSTSTTTTP